MKILLIGSQSFGTKNDPNVIFDQLVAAGGSVELVYWEDLQIHAQTGRVDICVEGRDIFDGVDKMILFGWYKGGHNTIYRDISYSVALVAKQKGIAIWNSEALSQRSTTKLSCMVQLALEGVSIPETWFSLRDTEFMYTRPAPYIAKAVSASRGRDNYLVDGDLVRKRVLEEHQEKRFIVQEYLENDHDLRIICFGGIPQLVLKRSRSRSDTHLNNTSQGGGSKWLNVDETPPQLLTECNNICIITKREMAGIDFIPDPKSPYGYSCLEVNAIPQLTSGYDVDKKMAALVEAVLR